jgi:soluble lytic murein transglycosylase-like protein
MSKFEITRAGRRSIQSLGVFLMDTWQGLVVVSHHAFLMVGLAAAGLVVFVASRADVREQIETQTLGWLQAREQARVQLDTASSFAATLAKALAEPMASERATAADPAELSRQQAAVAYWLSRRYHVAPEPVSRLVQEAWSVGKQAHLEPTLILAVMAIESGFNPFAQSPVGAQGLMQVMTRVHDEKYEAFGGMRAAFDPVTNLRVGAQVLKECIARGGSLAMGLKYYVGAANLDDDGGYAAKVLSEQAHLRDIVAGRNVPANAPQLTATQTQDRAPATGHDSRDAATEVHPPAAVPPAASSVAQLHALPSQRVALAP